MGDDQRDAAAEFRYAAGRYVEAPSVGTRYALEMAAVACQIRGMDPSRITPDGYDDSPAAPS